MFNQRNHLLYSTAMVAALAVSCMANYASAGFITPGSWVRGTANTTYQEWDKFDTTVGPNSPNSPGNPIGANVAAAAFNPNGTANTRETSAVAFLTGGGNIYSPTGTIIMASDIPNYNLGPTYETHVIFQIKTQGTEIDYGNIKLGGFLISSYAAYTQQELSRTALGGFGGDSVEWAATFTILGNASNYQFTWSALGSSSSQDKVSIDTYTELAIPEPASLGFAGLGALALLLRRRR